MLQNGQILFLYLYNLQLADMITARGDILVIDRGYEELVIWAIKRGFNLIHTQKRIKNHPHVFGIEQWKSVGDRMLVPEEGEMGVYWAKKVEQSDMKQGSTTIWTVACRVGTHPGRVVMLTTTLPWLGPEYWFACTKSKRYVYDGTYAIINNCNNILKDLASPLD